MITLYDGTPGSGKSLHLIKTILNNLKWGRDVICNFAIKFTDKEIQRGYDKRFYYVTNEKLTINYLIEHAIDHEYFEKKKESQCLVVYDEAGGKFNTRDFQQKDRMEWIDFFSQHRKCGFDFILVAQSDRMIDRQIRGFIETEKVHRKINNYAFFWILPFPVFVAIERWYVAKERVGAEFFMYHKSWGSHYDSMKMFDGFKMSPELLKKIQDKKRSSGDQELDVKKDEVQEDEKFKNDESMKKFIDDYNSLNVPMAAVFKNDDKE
jgi:zona occludens toxin